MVEGPWTVYILYCVDNTYYVGFTNDLDTRLAQHRQGVDPAAYTYLRRPLQLVWSEDFPDHDDAFRLERQIKGWSHAKKAALVSGGLTQVHEVVRKAKRAERSDEGAELKRR